MKKFPFLAAAAALAMTAVAPAAAAADTAEMNLRAVSATEGESNLEGGTSWILLVLLIGAAIGGIALSGDTDAPVSP